MAPGAGSGMVYPAADSDGLFALSLTVAAFQRLRRLLPHQTGTASWETVPVFAV